MRPIFAFGRALSITTALLILAQSAIAAPPIIHQFSPQDTQLLPGENTLVAVRTTGATSVYLDPGHRLVARHDVNSWIRVHPAETTTYELVAVNADGETRAAAEVRVGPFRVEYFRSTAALLGAQEPTTLRWHVAGETDAIELVGFGLQDDYGTAVVVPGESRSYELRVSSGAVTESSFVEVEVSDQFNFSRFYLSFSEDSIEPVAPDLGVYTPFDVHVLGVSLEGRGMKGFEMGLDLPPGLAIASVDYHTPLVLNMVEPPDFIVGFAYCLPTNNTLYTVATLNVVAMNDEVLEAGYINLRPAIVQSVPDRLAYVTCRDGLEGSEYSSPIVTAGMGPRLYLNPDHKVPTLQLGFRAEQDENSVRLAWGDLPYPLVDRIEIGRSEAGAPPKPVMVLRGEELLSTRAYEDFAAPRGVELSYVLRAYDGQDLLSEEIAKMAAAGEIPERTQITGNYPNPFNPETTIRFNATQAGRFEFRIVDAAGRRVRRLTREVHGAGVGYEVHWDGRDGRGMPAASGVYFVEMRGPNSVDKHRIALIK